MKNVDVRYEVLEDSHAMDDFALGNEKQHVKNYLLSLIVEDMILCVGIEQGSRKISESLIAIVVPK